MSITASRCAPPVKMILVGTPLLVKPDLQPATHPVFVGEIFLPKLALEIAFLTQHHTVVENQESWGKKDDAPPGARQKRQADQQALQANVERISRVMKW